VRLTGGRSEEIESLESQITSQSSLQHKKNTNRIILVCRKEHLINSVDRKQFDILEEKKTMNSDHFIPVPARLDDSADVVKDGHGLLPAGQQLQRVRRFLNRTRRTPIEISHHFDSAYAGGARTNGLPRRRARACVPRPC
jgi:hypothetical protein